MTDYERIEKLFMNNLDLRHRPVAVSFLESPPPAIEKFEGVQPSGCSFWKLASEGRVFYTVGADHFNCPIGSYTHNISLPESRARELPDTLEFMTNIGYLRMEEVPAILRLPETPEVVLYAPLADTPEEPDVVLFWGPPGKVMVLQEAAIRAGAATQLNTLGRPTCMVLPAALKHGTVASSGCIGNRVYTGLDEAELYVAIPGSDIGRVAEQTAVIRAANATLRQYHEGRKRELTSV
ncbi:MAG TPA: DUF169 domain-containing protein [Vicinamibacterales bacterium]